MVDLVIHRSKVWLNVAIKRSNQLWGNGCSRTIAKIGQTVNIINRLTSSLRLWNLGLLQVVYSINTTSAKSTGKSPYEVVFGQKPRCDIEMWQVLSNQGVVNEDLPNDFTGALKECDNFIDAIEYSALSNVDEPSSSYSNIAQTPPKLSSTILYFNVSYNFRDKKMAKSQTVFKSSS